MPNPRLAAAVVALAIVPIPFQAQPSVPGPVVLDLTLNERGEVEDVRVLSGPAEFRPLALKIFVSQKQGGGPGSQQVSFFAKGTTIPPQPSTDQAELVGIDYNRLPLALQQRVMPLAANLKAGQRITAAEFDQLDKSLIAIDSSLRLVKRTTPTAQGLRLLIMADDGLPPPSDTRVTGSAQAAKLTHKVEPEYPPLARQARIQGTVRFNIYLTAEGTVERALLLSGHPSLVPAATEAVTQYRYDPTLLNGKPVSVQTQVDIDFEP